MDDIDRRIVNELQGGFPLVARPFETVAARLGLDEEDLIDRIRGLLADRTLTRFGPLFQIERAGGAFTLAAMSVPAAEYDHVARVVNEFPQVAHNYAREHRLNMWFVLATEHPEDIEATIRRIEETTGHTVIDFPKEREFFVELRFSA